MWPNFQNHHGRIFPAQRTARGICPQHVDGLGVKTDEMRVVQSHSHGWAYGWMCWCDEGPPETRIQESEKKVCTSDINHPLIIRCTMAHFPAKTPFGDFWAL